MGHLIPTEIEDQGHQISFEYQGQDANQKCLSICTCGWRTEIESFRHPWSFIEVKVRVREHFEALGLQPGNAGGHAIYSFNEKEEEK